MCRADAVGARIAATDDEHVLALGVDELVLRNILTCQHTVLLREHLQREVDTLELSARNLQVASLRSTGAYHHGIVLLRQFLEGDDLILSERWVVLYWIDRILVADDVRAVLEGDALSHELLQAPVDDLLVQFEVRDAVA